MVQPWGQMNCWHLLWLVSDNSGLGVISHSPDFMPAHRYLQGHVDARAHSQTSGTPHMCPSHPAAPTHLQKPLGFAVAVVESLTRHAAWTRFGMPQICSYGVTRWPNGDGTSCTNAPWCTSPHLPSTNRPRLGPFVRLSCLRRRWLSGCSIICWEIYFGVVLRAEGSEKFIFLMIIYVLFRFISLF